MSLGLVLISADLLICEGADAASRVLARREQRRDLVANLFLGVDECSVSVRVAVEGGVDEHWLNDGVKGYLSDDPSSRPRSMLFVALPDAYLHPSQLLPLEMLRRPLELAQFTSDEYQRFLKGHQIRSSMSAVGTCADNAAAESFFGLLKRERVNRRQYLTRSEARADVFDYIERFHNPRRARKIEQLKKEEVGLTQPSVETG
jgi:hypothetical protein